jgi:ribosomal protein S18 acetylase RimI-like enzyme/DNA-binding MarR family transcriptional regulator
MRVSSETTEALRRVLALHERLLGEPGGETRSVERILAAIGRRGSAVPALGARLALGSAELGASLRRLTRQGLARFDERRHRGERARFVTLTRAGAARLRRIDVREEARARQLAASRSNAEIGQLTRAMVQIERFLCRSRIVIAPEDPASGAARWCFAQYFDELAARFPGGFDRNAGGGTVREEFLPPRGRLLIARLDGDPVGCGAVRAWAPGIVEIKRMWVAPEARGLGIGGELLEALERLARRRRARAIRLDTHATLTEALRLYRRAGYRRIARYNDNPYAQRWFEKVLR